MKKMSFKISKPKKLNDNRAKARRAYIDMKNGKYYLQVHLTKRGRISFIQRWVSVSINDRFDPVIFKELRKMNLLKKMSRIENLYQRWDLEIWTARGVKELLKPASNG
jgi:hypothetical protein